MKKRGEKRMGKGGRKKGREGGREEGEGGKEGGGIKKILVFVLKETTQTTQRQLQQCG